MHRENELERFHNLSPNLIVGAGKEWNAGNQGRVKVQNQIFSNKHREAATEIRGTHKGKHANMQKQRKKVKDSTEDARIAWKTVYCCTVKSKNKQKSKTITSAAFVVSVYSYYISSHVYARN